MRCRSLTRRGPATGVLPPRSSWHRDLIGQRMTDELGFHADEHRRTASRTAAGTGSRSTALPIVSHPTLTPRPDLRTHVLDVGNAARLELRHQPQIEFLRVDADVDIRRVGQQRARAARARMRSRRGRCGMISNRPMTERLSSSLPGLAAFRNHPRTGNAGEARIRQTLPQGMNQLSAEIVAGSFAGDEDDEGTWGLGFGARAGSGHRPLRDHQAVADLCRRFACPCPAASSHASSHDPHPFPARCAVVEEIHEGLEFRLLATPACELFCRIDELQLRAIQRAIRLADIANLVRA